MALPRRAQCCPARFPARHGLRVDRWLPIQYGIYGWPSRDGRPNFCKEPLHHNRTNQCHISHAAERFRQPRHGRGGKTRMVPLLILMVGLLQDAPFKVANLVQYISRSVITGYITAALLIITNQIPKSLGLEMLDKEATFYQSAVLMFQSIHTALGDGFC